MNNNLEQQKIYIDVDEEITTVVDHLLHTQGNNIILVVPQHALLLQSVVNLKLLAQETEKLQKNLIMMTNDVDGIAFAQRAGIVTQPYVSDDDLDHNRQSAMLKKEKIRDEMYVRSVERASVEVPQKPINKMIGSQSYHGQKQHIHNVDQNMPRQRYLSESAVSVASTAPMQHQRASEHGQISQKMPQQYAQRSPQHVNVVQPLQKNRQSQSVMTGNGSMVSQSQQRSQSQLRQSSLQRGKVQDNTTMHQRSYHQNVGIGASYAKNEPYVTNHEEQEDLSQYEQSLRASQISDAEMYRPHEPNADVTINERTNIAHQKKSFVQHSVDHKKKSKKKDVSHVSGGTGFVLKGFMFTGIFLIVVVLLIVLLPQTDLSITPKHIAIDDKIEITANIDQQEYDGDRRLIPVRLIERDMTFTKTFPTTGQGNVDAQNAQGIITIYNTYSEQSQPLVAKTRFLSEDGMLVRLVNAATVPGMKDGEPGTVQALVIADQPGEQGNIDPTRFSVPGFVGSPKENKFYGVSDRIMSGGGAGGTGVAVVTQEDIDNAAKNLDAEISAYIQEQLTAMLRPESEILLPNALTSERVRAEASVSPGTMGETFMYEVVSHVKALVFSEEDVLAVMESSVADDMQQYDMDQVEMTLTYNDVKANFENDTLKMTVHGIAQIIAVVDLSAFKKDIIGKKHDDLLSIIEGKYSNVINKITIESVVPGTPAFLANRISRLGFMTSITIAE